MCVQVARGTYQQNVDYVTKEEGRIDGPWEEGEKPVGEKKKRLRKACQLIREGSSVEHLPDECDTVRVMHHKGLRQLQTDLERGKRARYRQLTVRVLWGETGLGKTRWVYENYPLEDIFKLTEPEGKLWWDGYRGQRVLLIDDFSGWIKYRHLLNLLDVYPMDLEVKGGFAIAQYQEVFITSNLHPAQWYSQHGLDAPLARRLHHIDHIQENLFPEGDEQCPVWDEGPSDSGVDEAMERWEQAGQPVPHHRHTVVLDTESEGEGEGTQPDGGHDVDQQLSPSPFCDSMCGSPLPDSSIIVSSSFLFY